ncbi:MAG TPA: ATP-binding protein [Bacteroidales bacterium]|nr:ATP-binding protein [Bacteroidales bacterium]
MIRRTIESQLKALEGKYPVLSLTGPRQSGKTTLVKSVFPDYHYTNLESVDIRLFATEDPRGFLQAFGDRLIIDEAQHIPELFSYIQVLVDADPKKRFILTGSQNFLLLERISQSLAGRVALFYLLPFSIEELYEGGLTPVNYTTYLINGGYPPIYDKALDPSVWLQNYITTYIERDVRTLLNVINLTDFQRFVGMCAGRIGQLINFNSIATELSVSYHTVQSWLSILEASFITFRLLPYHSNYNKRLVKSSKLYFNDTGLACALLGIRNEEQLMTHYLKGGLFENMVISELRKYHLNHNTMGHLYFWRDSNGNEVDCITEIGASVRAIEIKAGSTVHPDFFKPLLWFRQLSGISDAYLVYGGDESYHRSGVELLSWKQGYFAVRG